MGEEMGRYGKIWGDVGRYGEIVEYVTAADASRTRHEPLARECVSDGDTNGDTDGAERWRDCAGWGGRARRRGLGGSVRESLFGRPVTGRGM